MRNHILCNVEYRVRYLSTRSSTKFSTAVAPEYVWYGKFGTAVCTPVHTAVHMYTAVCTLRVCTGTKFSTAVLNLVPGVHTVMNEPITKVLHNLFMSNTVRVFSLSCEK